jgi:hypothetical protein
MKDLKKLITNLKKKIMKKTIALLFIVNIYAFCKAQNKDSASHSTELRLSIGSNIDELSQKIKLRGSYFRLSFFKDSLIHLLGGFEDSLKRHHIFLGFGLYAGLYQNIYFTKSITNVNEVSSFSTIEKIPNIDKLLRTKHTMLSDSLEIKNSNLGFFVSIPFFGYTNKINAKSRFGLNLNMDLDYLRRTEITTKTYSEIFNSSDTIYIANFKADDFKSVNLSAPQQRLFQETLIGGGLSAFYANEDIEILLKCAIGSKKTYANPVSNQIDIDERDFPYKQIAAILYFSVMERRYGFRIGGEIRSELKGLFPNEHIYYNIFVTKTFDLGRLNELIKL